MVSSNDYTGYGNKKKAYKDDFKLISEPFQIEKKSKNLRPTF